MYIISKEDEVGIVNLDSQDKVYIGRNAIRVNPLAEAVYNGKDLDKRFKDLKDALGAGVHCYDFSKRIGDWKKKETAHSERSSEPKSQENK